MAVEEYIAWVEITMRHSGLFETSSGMLKDFGFNSEFYARINNSIHGKREVTEKSAL